MEKIAFGLAALAAAAMAPMAQAQTVLTFEGVANGASVGDYYNGGAGGNLGIQFVNALGLVDADAGGTGNFANEPSANTIIFFTSGSASTMNIAAGFTNGFSFFYTSSTAASVDVYSGLNGTSTLLASIPLAAQFNTNCSGDPSGSFCNWTAVGVTFAGTALSANFNGTAGQTGFDNITIGSAVAGGVPEPASWAMMIGGFGLAGFAKRRRVRASEARADRMIKQLGESALA